MPNREIFNFKYPLKILYVSDLNFWGRAFQRYKALQDLVCDVDGLTSFPMSDSPVHKASLFERLKMKLLRLQSDVVSVNNKIKYQIGIKIYDIVWIDKGNTIKPSTLEYIKIKSPSTIFVSSSEDDMYLPHNYMRYYKFGLRYYDIAFTTKVYNIEELKTFGAKRVVLFLDSYDETLHRPLKLSNEDLKEYQSDVGFIGTFENDRYRYMHYLAQNGINVRIYGDGWESHKGRHNNLVIKGCAIYAEEYVKAINATKINLCFLRKMNRDLVTSRSSEIPACGGFMLAERTDRHLSLFEENKEAVFFSTKEELLEKVKVYLGDDDSRRKIAEAGRRRCENSGYGMRSQLRKMLEYILDYTKAKNFIENENVQCL